MVRSLRQLLLASTFPVTFTSVVIGSIVVGVADTVTVLTTCFVLFTPSALGAATAATATADTAHAVINFFIANPSPFLAFPSFRASSQSSGEAGLEDTAQFVTHGNNG